MALARWQATIVDESGDVQPLASIEVRREIPGQPLVALFSDRDGVVPIANPGNNPFLADADGFAFFHVAGGAYQITATLGGFTRVWRYVAMGTAGELDGSAIVGVAGASNVLTGNGVTTAFDISILIGSAASLLWVEDGIPQRPGVDFTVSGSTVTRTTAPADGAIIFWVLFGSAGDVTDLSTKVDKAGDAMSGPLSLSGDGSSALHAVPKQQLDAGLALKLDDTQLDTDGTLAANSATKIPAQSAVKTYADARETAAKAYADTLVVGLIDDRGNYDASGNVFPSTGGSGTAGAILKGDLWFVSVAGTLGGALVAVGDQVRALVDTPGQTAGNWAVSEGNVGFVPENVANKDTDGTLAANSTTKYPAQSAVVTYVTAAVAAGLAALRNGVASALDTLAEIATELALKATLESPTFTGVPAGPTAGLGTNTTQLATMAAIQAAFAAGGALKSKIIEVNRDLTAATGSVSYTGVGFQPTLIVAVGAVANNALTSYATYLGMVDSTLASKSMGANAGQARLAGVLLQAIDAAGTSDQQFIVTSLDADGLTGTWTKTGTPTGTFTSYLACLR